jgi:hypothetical protein
MLYWINSLNCSNTCIEGKKWREADFIPSLAYKIKFDVSFYRCYAIENNKSKIPNLMTKSIRLTKSDESKMMKWWSKMPSKKLLINFNICLFDKSQGRENLFWISLLETAKRETELSESFHSEPSQHFYDCGNFYFS